MQNLQIALIEDNKSAALDVEMLLDEMGIKLASVKDNAEDALHYIYKEQPDLIIMDIELKGEKSGIDVAKEIDHLRIPIIFTTSYKDKKSYEAAKEVYSFGYLVKPFNRLSLQSALEQAIKALFPEGQLEAPSTEGQEGMVLKGMVLVKHLNMLYPVKFSDILYIQGEGNYCSIFTCHRKFLLKTSLRKLIASLPTTEFVPIHKSYIVRLDKVESIDIGSSKLCVGMEELPLGRNFKNTFLERFNVLK
jgi:DNA-binding LytR/AlgR family response regulator